MISSIFGLQSRRLFTGRQKTRAQASGRRQILMDAGERLLQLRDVAFGEDISEARALLGIESKSYTRAGADDEMGNVRGLRFGHLAGDGPSIARELGFGGLGDEID